MNNLSGIRAETPDNIVFGAGVAYANIDIEALESTPAEGRAWDLAIANAIPLGATRGGASFSANRTFRDIEIDGTLGAVRGLTRRDEVRPTLSVSFVELTKENLERAIAGARSEIAGKFQMITGGEIEDGDYIDNIAMAAMLSGSDEPVVFVLFNALATEVGEFATEDRNEMVAQATFLGHFPLESARDESQVWRVYRPLRNTPEEPDND